jgi:ATP-dependent Zn protease
MEEKRKTVQLMAEKLLEVETLNREQFVQLIEQIGVPA